MSSDYIKLVLRYIGMDLAYKNFKNDIAVWDKTNSHSNRIWIAKTEAVMEVLKRDQELLRRNNRMYVKLLSKDNEHRVYSWRFGKDQGSVRLTSQQLYKLTEKISFEYFVEKDIEFELKPYY
jgi:uncharacterized protein with PIN domain